MARQVYFDPFGMRVEGMRAGMKDEIELQDQTRRARASDWDFDNMAPLRLAGAQREDQYGTQAMPYRLRSLGMNERTALGNEYDANQNRLSIYGQETGNYAPYMTDQELYLNNQYQNASEYRAPYSQYVRADLDGQLDLFGGTDGLRSMAEQYGIDPKVLIQLASTLSGRMTQGRERSTDQRALWDRSRQDAQDTFGYTQDRSQLYDSRMNANTNAQNAQTQQQRYNGADYGLPEDNDPDI